MPVYKMYDIHTETVTIANGASLSGATSELDGRLVAVMTDSAWDTNSMTFQVSFDGSTYYNLYDDVGEYTISSVVASTCRSVNLNNFIGARYIKVRSGTSGAAVNQNGDTVVSIITFKFEG